MKSNEYQINPSCTACVCHKSARSVCLKGRNTNGLRRLVVFTDHPDYFADNAGRPYAMDVRRLLDWMFYRMSVDPKDVAYEYTLRCYAKNTLPTQKADRAICIEECAQYRFATIAKLKPKAIAVLGTVSLEAFTGHTQIGNWVDRPKVRAWEPVVRDYVENVWVAYSLNFCIMSPSSTPSVFRVLYQASREAGLNPVINPNIPPFVWSKLHH